MFQAVDKRVMEVAKFQTLQTENVIRPVACANFGIEDGLNAWVKLKIACSSNDQNNARPGLLKNVLNPGPEYLHPLIEAIEQS